MNDVQASDVLSRELWMTDLRRTNLTEDIESAFTNFSSPAAPVKTKDLCDMKQDGFTDKHSEV